MQDFQLLKSDESDLKSAIKILSNFWKITAGKTKQKHSANLIDGNQVFGLGKTYQENPTVTVYRQNHSFLQWAFKMVKSGRMFTLTTTGWNVDFVQNQQW